MFTCVLHYTNKIGNIRVIFLLLWNYMDGVRSGVSLTTQTSYFWKFLWKCAVENLAQLLGYSLKLRRRFYANFKYAWNRKKSFELWWGQERVNYIFKLSFRETATYCDDIHSHLQIKWWCQTFAKFSDLQVPKNTWYEDKRRHDLTSMRWFIVLTIRIYLKWNGIIKLIVDAF